MPNLQILKVMVYRAFHLSITHLNILGSTTMINTKLKKSRGIVACILPCRGGGYEFDATYNFGSLIRIPLIKKERNTILV